MLLLDLVALLVVLFFLSGLAVWVYSDGKKSGIAQGRKEVWDMVGECIKRQVPLSINYRGLGQLSIQKLYDIKKRRDPNTRIHQPGSIFFSDKPTENGEINASIKKGDRVTLVVTFPVEQIPKGLWGKTLEMQASYLGWDGPGED